MMMSKQLLTTTEDAATDWWYDDPDDVVKAVCSFSYRCDREEFAKLLCLTMDRGMHDGYIEEKWDYFQREGLSFFMHRTGWSIAIKYLYHWWKWFTGPPAVGYNIFMVDFNHDYVQSAGDGNHWYQVSISHDEEE
jgi:hypothetical protein